MKEPKAENFPFFNSPSTVEIAIKNVVEHYNRYHKGNKFVSESNKESQMKKFKVGDKVYAIRKNGNIYTLKNTCDIRLKQNFPLIIHEIGECYTDSGKAYVRNAINDIIHATKENYNALITLFPEVVWEKPKRVLKGSELCKHLLKTRTHVVCMVSDESDTNACSENFVVDCILSRNVIGGFFIGSGRFARKWNFAVPINTDTLSPLEMEIDCE